MKIFISVVMIKDIGGISTSVKNLLSEIALDHDVTLCVLADYISPNVKLPDTVKLLKGSSVLRDCFCDRAMLKYQTPIQKLVRNIRRLKRRIVGTDAVVSSEVNKMTIPGEYDVGICFSNDIYDASGKMIAGGVNSLVANKVKAKRKASWIHNDAKSLGFTRELCLKMYSAYHAIVNVSCDCKKVFDEMVPDYIDKSFVVYNMYDIALIKARAEEFHPYEKNGKVHFVTVARLYNHQKRIDRIIETVSRLKMEGYTNFDWTIVGEGGDRPMFETMISDNDIGDILYLAGLKTNPYPYMKNADAFVLTSDYEGYPMTIKEAQILAVPILITEFGSAHEAVSNRIDGIICERSTNGVYSMVKSVLDNRNILTELKKSLQNNPITNQKALQQFLDVCK